MQSTFRIDQNESSNAVAKRPILVYWSDYDKFDELLVFGPNYMPKDAGLWRQEKKEALRHVLGKSECSDVELKDAIVELKDAMGSIERDARAVYLDDVLNNMTGDFLDMMAEDGCFFLLLSFFILGAGPELKFPEKHLVFGVGRAAEHKTMLLKSIFLVGNQVPLIVLDKLMELPFFQELKNTANQWNQPSEELPKRTLHKFLMEGQNPYAGDLIRCLQLIMLGTETSSVKAIPEILQSGQGIIPSALQLSQRGVQFETLDPELGIRSINYQHSTFNSVLYLPVFMVDKHTELMVECLTKYEFVQSWRAPVLEREASSYFKLLKDLMPTKKDLEILSSCGVIKGEPESLQRLLSKIESSKTSAHLYQIRQQINEVRPLPWRNSIKLTLKVIWTLSTCLMLIFTYLQVHYTILAYYQKAH